MNKFILILYLFNILSFLIYGTTCLVTERMANEFQRYKLSALRVPTGILQILFSLMMIYGLYESQFVLFSSALLTVTMGVAVAVRIRIKDNLKACLPAAFYLVINIFICAYSIIQS